MKPLFWKYCPYCGDKIGIYGQHTYDLGYNGSSHCKVDIYPFVHDSVLVKHYVVQPGDNLHMIAFLFNTTVERLVKDNNLLDRNLIYPGQRLAIKYDHPPPP